VVLVGLQYSPWKLSSEEGLHQREKFSQRSLLSRLDLLRDDFDLPFFGFISVLFSIKLSNSRYFSKCLPKREPKKTPRKPEKALLAKRTKPLKKPKPLNKPLRSKLNQKVNNPFEMILLQPKKLKKLPRVTPNPPPLPNLIRAIRYLFFAILNPK
jgi:hypothetical protein